VVLVFVLLLLLLLLLLLFMDHCVVVCIDVRLWPWGPFLAVACGLCLVWS